LTDQMIADNGRRRAAASTHTHSAGGYCFTVFTGDVAE